MLLFIQTLSHAIQLNVQQPLRKKKCRNNYKTRNIDFMAGSHFTRIQMKTQNRHQYILIHPLLVFININTFLY